MKIWMVEQENWEYDDIVDSYIVGGYSNLGLAARAAIQCFFTIDDKVINRIADISCRFDNTYHILGANEDDFSTSISIYPLTIDDI